MLMIGEKLFLAPLKKEEVKVFASHLAGATHVGFGESLRGKNVLTWSIRSRKW